jgi:hypothetical protein
MGHKLGCPQLFGALAVRPCACQGVENQLPSQAPDPVALARVQASQARIGSLVEGMSQLVGERANDLGEALSVRPPLGLRPKYCVGKDESPRYRLREIAEAMNRYTSAGKSLPYEWIVELAEVNLHVMMLNEKEGQ